MPPLGVMASRFDGKTEPRILSDPKVDEGGRQICYLGGVSEPPCAI